jgi:hypothetical protein
MTNRGPNRPDHRPRQAESKVPGKLGETHGGLESAGGQNKRKPARITMAVGGKYTHSRGKGKGKFATHPKCGNRGIGELLVKARGCEREKVWFSGSTHASKGGHGASGGTRWGRVGGGGGGGGGRTWMVAAEAGGGGLRGRELAGGRGGLLSWLVAAAGRWWPKTGAGAGASVMQMLIANW